MDGGNVVEGKVVGGVKKGFEKKVGRKERREERRRSRKLKKGKGGVVDMEEGGNVEKEGEGVVGDTMGKDGDGDGGVNVEEVVVEEDVLRTARISRKGVNAEVMVVFPNVGLGTYGKSWNKDVYLLSHNAIKAELLDLYGMCNVMQRKIAMLTREHVRLFYEWFDDFQAFCLTAIRVEEEVLYPGLVAKDYLRGRLKDSQRMLTNGRFRVVMQDIVDYKKEFVPQLPVGERLAGLMQLVKGFDAVLEYTEAAREGLGEFIAKHFKKRQMKHLEKDVVMGYRGIEGYDRSMVLLSRWMKDGGKKWAVSCLKKSDMFHFGGWKRMIMQEHCSIPRRFEAIIVNEDGDDGGTAAVGAAMAITPGMRLKLDKNRASVRDI